MANKYDCLKIENQLCFPLYAASREVIKQYNPYLQKIDLTYTQYVAMMVLWDVKKTTVKDLGEKLYLDSGTLTPLLKSLEAKGFVTRSRSKEDERVLIVEITAKGEELKNEAVEIPKAMMGCVKLTQEEAATLYSLLYKVLGNL